MKPFVEAYIDVGTLEEFTEKNKAMFGEFSDEEISFQYERLKADLIYVNGTYQVNADTKTYCANPIGVPLIHLMIKRIDGDPICDWNIIQEIKNMILGEEADCAELYPSESRNLKVDNNQTHLWCLATGNTFPFGWAGEPSLENTDNQG